MNSVFIVAPSKIIEPQSDIQNLGETLSNPLKLRIVDRSEAYDSIRLVRALD